MGHAADREPATARPAPTDPGERHLAVDALRGWALLGIALVNVPWIGFRESLPSMLASETTRASLAPLDLAAALFVEGLCEGRFYPIFSALFGLGTGVLLDRGGAIYARRIAVLFGFGVLHATFGWFGDVLLNYAFAGLVLVLLARLRARSLFALAALLLVVTQLLSLCFDTWLAADVDPAEHLAYVEGELRIYRDGTFLSITRHRWDEMLGYFSTYLLSYRANVLAMAILGLALERSGVLEHLPALRPRIGRLALVLLALGAGGIALAWAVPHAYLLSGDVLAGGYSLGFLWLALGPRAARWIAPFAAVGRTALTCYLVQTLCFTLFFYGYGLARYGAHGPSDGVLLSIAVYAFEAGVAVAWLRHYRLGPFEWLWRALTYLQAPRFLR